MPKLISGAEIVFKSLEDQKVEYIFGYPGGAVLPIYDELKNHKSIKHILARHEQGAGHAAEGYARSSGKPGVLLVTSGPGATNAVTALTDAYMDSVPLVCISGQVPTHLIGTDAFQECDTTGITRPCTKHNWLVKDVNDLSRVLHLAFEVATTGRPGPVLVDIPKDIQFKKGKYNFTKSTLKKKLNGKSTHKVSNTELDKFIELIKKENKMENTSQVPVTVLTGFLGAGKTTLLNRILTEQHGRKYAVIVNEFGEQGIDNDLVVDADEEVFEMNNGCICCTVRGDLIRILSGLMKRADQLDAIIVETTGLADPAPVAQTFFVDEDVADRTKLDAIVTVADAVHLSSQLADHHEAEEQIAFADVVLLNKVELVDEDDLEKVKNRIRKINPFAKIIKTTRCDAPLDEIVGLNAFSLDRVLQIEPDFLESDHDHEHDDDVTSVSFISDTPLDMEKFQAWFGDLLRTKGQDILRSKGILDFKGEEERYVFQGVHMLMDASPMGSWPKGKDRSSRIVFIGRNLDSMNLKEGFENCKIG